eukprot:3851162-Rhodomonas_salina.2
MQGGRTKPTPGVEVWNIGRLRRITLNASASAFVSAAPDAGAPGGLAGTAGFGGGMAGRCRGCGKQFGLRHWWQTRCRPILR